MKANEERKTRRSTPAGSSGLLKPALVQQAWEYYNTVQTKDQKYIPLLRPDDKPPTFLNEKIMATYREKMKKFYFDPTKYKTYLEQLAVAYPPAK